MSDISIEVRHAELSWIGDTQFYVVSYRVQIGEMPPVLWQHNIPVGTFESRAAEYGIDPDSETGWDELLEMVIYDSWTSDPPEEQLADPEHLYNAPTIAIARKAKQRKLRSRRGRGKLRGTKGWTPGAIVMEATAVDNSGEEDPLEFIKRTAPMSREHMKVRAEFTRRHRNHIRALRAGAKHEGLGLYEEAEDRTRRDMKLRRRETPQELAERLMGFDPVPTVDGEYREPPSTLLGRTEGVE